MRNCHTDVSKPYGGVPCCTPIDVVVEREYRECTDSCGRTALYPADCRVEFWPSFSHPRWLCCEDLYSGAPVTPCGGDCCERECR